MVNDLLPKGIGNGSTSVGPHGSFFDCSRYGGTGRIASGDRGPRPTVIKTARPHHHPLEHRHGKEGIDIEHTPTLPANGFNYLRVSATTCGISMRSKKTK
jgi:hypothetical protein